jgi:hypothetical protein
LLRSKCNKTTKDLYEYGGGAVGKNGLSPVDVEKIYQISYVKNASADQLIKYLTEQNTCIEKSKVLLEIISKMCFWNKDS